MKSVHNGVVSLDFLFIHFSEFLLFLETSNDISRYMIDAPNYEAAKLGESAPLGDDNTLYCTFLHHKARQEKIFLEKLLWDKLGSK